MHQLPIYYIYFHLNPKTDEVIYVGYGSNHRAWVFNSTSYRQKQHHEFLQQLVKDGYIPSDWVIIKDRNIFKEEALKLERQYIKEHDPIFNTMKGPYSMTDKDKIKQACLLRSQGLCYEKIKKEMNLKSNMTAWRYANANITL